MYAFYVNNYLIIPITVPVTLIMETITFRNLNEYVLGYLEKFMKDKRFNYVKKNADIIVDIGSMDDNTYGRLAGIMTTTLVKLEPGIDVSLTKKTTAFVKTHILGHEKAKREKNCLWITPEDYAGLIIAIQFKESHVVISPNIYLHRMTTDIKELIKKATTYITRLEKAIRSADAAAFEAIDKELRCTVIASFITMETVDVPVIQDTLAPTKHNDVKAMAPTSSVSTWASIAKSNMEPKAEQLETEVVPERTFSPVGFEQRTFVNEDYDKLITLQRKFNETQSQLNELQIKQTLLIKELSILGPAIFEVQVKLGLAQSVQLDVSN